MLYDKGLRRFRCDLFCEGRRPLFKYFIFKVDEVGVLGATGDGGV